MVPALKNIYKNHFSALLMLLTFAQGLLYVFLIPPWEHYDEPTHFEYAWLIAYQNRIPEEGEYVQWMRRDLLGSMYDNNFFERRDFRVNPIEIGKPVWIGVSQLNDPPLYYLIVSLPLRLVKFLDFTTQLFIARLVSLLMFMLTVYLAFRISKEILPKNHILTNLIPLFILFLPGFADIMTSVSNDVGVVLLSTLFLWLGIRFLNRKQTFTTAVLLVIVTAMLVWTKNIGYFFTPLLGLVFLLAIRQQKMRIAAIGAIGFLVLLFLIIFVRWGAAPAYFSVSGEQESAFRVKDHIETDPDFKIVLERSERFGSPSRIIYFFNSKEINSIHSREITFGGISRSTATEIKNAYVLLINDRAVKAIDLQEKNNGAMLSASVAFTEEIKNMRLVLAPIADGEATIFYDDIFLASGSLDDYLEGNSPNLVRNGSAEKGFPLFDYQLSQLISSVFPIQINDLWHIFDWDSHQSYYKSSFARLFRTFWAVFNWGGVFLAGKYPYRWLVGITLLAAVGFLVHLLSKQRLIEKRMLVLLASVFITIWGAAFLRGFSSSFMSYTFIPVARYAYPAIYPSAFFFIVGLYKLVKLPKLKINIAEECGFSIFLFLLVSLNIWAIASFTAHFY